MRKRRDRYLSRNGEFSSWLGEQNHRLHSPVCRSSSPFQLPRILVADFHEAQDLDILGHAIPRGAQLFMLSAGPGITLPSVPVDEETRSPTSKAAKHWGVWDESRDLKAFERDLSWALAWGPGNAGGDG